MNPADVCLSFTIGYHASGLHDEAERLKKAVELLCGGRLRLSFKL